MLQALWSASSGMLAQQLSLDNVANNMANVNTPGYKKTRVDFQDLLYSQMREPGKVATMGQIITNGIQVGSGVRPAATQLSFEQGGIQATGNDLDHAIMGDAFFEVILPDGKKAYTRDGSLKLDADGFLVNAGGNIVNIESADGGLVNMAGAEKVSVDTKGTVYQDKQLFKLEAYTFNSPKDLQQVEPGVFRPTEKSGEALLVSELDAGDEEIEEIDESTDEDGQSASGSAAETESAARIVYYQITLEDGDIAYTRDSSFKVDEENRLVTVDKGYPLEPEVVFDEYEEEEDSTGSLKPGDTVNVDKDGVAWLPEEAGKLNLMRFTNPGGLEKIGSNLYQATVNSGAAQAAADFRLEKGAIEASNVQVAEEMVTMMMAQRAYELSSRSIKTSDDMLGIANSLLRR